MSYDLDQLSKTVGNILRKQKFKLVTAESCTGGGLAFTLTNHAGSSDWFERGFVSYSNTAKQELLGVRLATLANFGAVSQEVAAEMAKGALKKSAADISIAITGIAGPTGGTPDKPVGTVWIAIASFGCEQQQHFLFSGDRAAIRAQSIQAALQLTLNFIMD